MSDLVHLAVGPTPDGFRDLFPPDGEYAAAAPTLARLGDAGALAHEAIAHLYGYEMLERVRAGLLAGERRFALPLWPAGVFAALGIEAHGMAEIEGLLPAELELSLTALEPVEIARTARALGLPRFPPESYAAHVDGLATTDRWRTRFPRPDEPGTRAPERATAAAVILSEGRVLLERRPPDARVTPNVWDIPGGHVRDGESAADTLARELDEELGLSAPEVRHLFAFEADEPPDDTRYRHDVFLVRALDGGVEAREGQRLGWHDLRDALRLDDLNGPTGWALQELFERGEP